MLYTLGIECTWCNDKMDKKYEFFLENPTHLLVYLEKGTQKGRGEGVKFGVDHHCVRATDNLKLR